MNKQKAIIITAVLVDVIGFGIVIPILPFYLTEFGASALTITLLFSVFALCAFFSAPFLGALSDRIGRRPVLLLSIFSTSIGWFVFASATSIPFLFLGRIIDGLAAGNFTTAQSYLTDLAKDDKERLKNLGMVGAAFGVGFVLGPLLGGILSKVSHAFPFYVAGILALLNGISAFFFLEESHMHKNEAKLQYNPLLPLLRAYKSVTLRSLYIVWMLFSLSFVVVHSIFALFALKVFGFNSFDTGIFFTIIGVVIVLNQTILLNKFWMKRFTEKQLEQIMLFMMVIGLLMLASENLLLFFLSLPLTGTSQAVLRVVLSSQAIAKSDPKMKGEIMGIIASIMTGTLIIGPIPAGFLFEYASWLPFVTAALCSVYALFMSYRNT